MRLFAYYALHTFKNQLKKLFKTWVLIFLLVCFALGIGLGAFMSFIDDSSDEPEPEETLTEEEEPSLLEAVGMEPGELTELIAGGVVFIVFTFYAFNADKNGSKIFLPADVNLLFASPMKPQSVLMFRLTTQLGAAVLASAYMLSQLPNLTMNAGFSLWAALGLMAAWALTWVYGALIQMLLYTLSSIHPALKRVLRPGIYGLLGLIAAGYLLFAARSGGDWLRAAEGYFNAGFTRYIPVWGWLKGFCAFAVEGSLAGALLCLLALLLGGGALIYFIWHLKADFYEDAMAKSEETAELLERARSERSTGIVVKREKDRSDKLRRDGLRRGAGANVFFFKTMYNRFRFAHLGFLTKTAEFYLAAAALVALLCRFTGHAGSVMPVGLTLAGLSFFRSLGNPLEQDTSMDYFLLIPESTWAKLFWSLMGGTANCCLDVLPAIVAGALLAGANPLLALAWIPLIVSVDFYATNVGAFIGLSVPVAAGKMIKQIVQVMFIYFGLLPDIVIVALGIAFDHMAAALLGAAVLNLGLGFAFFGLSPLFIDPRDGKRRQDAVFTGDLRLARKQFSRLGLGAFVILAAATVLQLAAAGVAGRLYPEGGEPSWVMWLCTFAPMYLAAVPLGLLVLRRAPAAPREKHSLRTGQLVIAAIISVFMMYAGNILGSILLALLQAAMGRASVNPILSYVMDDSLGLRILVIVLLAPMIEEYVFRKQLIDRMNAYGEKLAVVTSALMFGLFHGNLSQFFYAFALGLVFGGVYLKTGRLRYSVGLHMLVNFLGSVLAPALLNRLDLNAIAAADMTDPAALSPFILQLLPFIAYVLAMLGLSVAGLVLLCVQIRRVRFDAAPLELPRGVRFKTVYLNAGMLLFILLCLASIVLTFVV